MKKLLMVAALTILSTVFCFGQMKMTAEQSIMKLEHDITDAVVKADTGMLDKYLADNVALTGPIGITETKTQFLNELKSGDLKFEFSKIDDMKVLLFDNAAVVTYSTMDKVMYKGQDISGHYRWTDTVVRINSKWLLVASQGTPITPQK